ncbi:hypothetical protein OROMI_023874 [Orobanche minor]
MDGKRRAHILEITLDQTYPRSPPSVSAIRQKCDGIFQEKSMYPNYSRKYEQFRRAIHDPECLKTSTQASAPAPTDSFVQELTKKIWQEVVVEVEAKLNQKVCAEVDGKISQKVQDMVLKKLVEANPILNVDIGEICATISSDTVGDGTPMTDGSSS